MGRKGEPNKRQEVNYLVNPYGVRALVDTMKTRKLSYDVDMFVLTEILEKKYTTRQRETWCIDTTGEIRRILNYIEEKALLN